MRKPVSAFICALLVCTLFFTGLSCIGGVQAVSKPAVPQFSIKIIGDAYDVPLTATTTVDPYTGKEITTTTGGYHQDDRKIEVSIKNQPFTPYTDSNGCSVRLYYIVQYKGHFSDDEWKDSRSPFFQSDSSYTVITQWDSVPKFVAGSQLDFRVKAIMGHEYIGQSYSPNSLSWVYVVGDNIEPHYYIDDTSSDWSPIQTMTILEYTNETPNQTEPTPNPTYASDQSAQPEMTIAGFSLFEFSLGIVLGAVVTGLIIALGYVRSKTARHKQTTQT